MDKQDFADKCGELLTMAKPHLVKCEYRLGKDILPTQFRQVPDDGEYVVVTCENGYQYYISVTADSLSAIMIDIFTAMMNK